MFTLDSVSCANDMPADGQRGGAQIIAQNGSSGGFFSVTGNDAFVELAYQAAAGSSIEWTPAVHVGVGNGILAAGTRGIRFSNYVPGLVAIVSAGLSEPLEPPLQLTAPGVIGSSSVSLAGDYKVSAQTANHVAGTGTWYICNGQALPAAETALIALVGANTPDARGRAPVMLGTHADVNALGDSDGVALANRTPKHSHTVVQPAIGITDPGHTHAISTFNSVGGGRPQTSGNINPVGDTTGSSTTGITATATGGTVGPAGGPTDTPGYVVPGSLFVFGSGV